MAHHCLHLSFLWERLFRIKVKNRSPWSEKKIEKPIKTKIVFCLKGELKECLLIR